MTYTYLFLCVDRYKRQKLLRAEFKCDKKTEGLDSEEQGKTTSQHWRCDFNDEKLQGEGVGELPCSFTWFYLTWANVGSKMFTFHIPCCLNKKKKHVFHLLQLTLAYTSEHIRAMAGFRLWGQHTWHRYWCGDLTLTVVTFLRSRTRPDGEKFRFTPTGTDWLIQLSPYLDLSES